MRIGFLQAGLPRASLFATTIGMAFMFFSGGAKASFLDDGAELTKAISLLRPVLGTSARILKIEIDAKTVVVEAQDPRNRAHVDRWRCGDGLLGLLPMRVSGPEPVDLALLDPDLEANLFDLDAIDFSAAMELEKNAIAKARLEGAAHVTHMEIARHVTILPNPKARDVIWTLSVASDRDHAEIFADAKGSIIGSDLSGTQRAKSLDLLKEPELVRDAAAAFREALGSGPVLTAIGIEVKAVSFATNIRDKAFGNILGGLPANASFTWSLDGLARRIGSVDISAQMGTAAPAAFAIDDVDWTVLTRLEANALAKLALPKARIMRLRVEKSSEGPGGPVLAWTIEIASDDNELTSVIADLKGAVVRVVLPARLRPKTVWLEPAALAGALSRIARVFGERTSIASLTADERGCRVTIDDPANGGKPATFEFASDSVTRAAISFSLDAMGPRFAVADLAPLTQEKLAALETAALTKLGESRHVYLESVRIGSHPFVPQAGAKAVEIRVRDVAQDSVRANYAWMVFDFDGRVLDSVTY